MPKSEWLSVAEAAARLRVSPRRVRQLLDAGDLTGDTVGRHVLVDSASVERRLTAEVPPGRPTGAKMAWAVLAALTSDGTAQPHDRLLRHRLAKLLAERRPADDWVTLLRRRATAQRYWAHPGVIDELLADPEVSVGRARAAALAGLRVSPGDDAVAYVRAAALPRLVQRYALQPDPDGRLEIRVVPEDAGEFAPVPGAPVPLAAAVLDMAESPDARMRAVAAQWLNARARPPATTAAPR